MSTDVAETKPGANGALQAEPPSVVELPGQAVQDLLGIAMGTREGQLYWRAWLLGRGLPMPGKGTIKILGATYAPRPAVDAGEE